jgi:hypothetical protein
MQYYSKDKDFQNLYEKLKEKNKIINYKSILCNPPNFNIFNDVKNKNNKGQYLSYDFQDTIELNPIRENCFNFDNQTNIKIFKENNKKEVINKNSDKLNKNSIIENLYNKKIKFVVKKENPFINKSIQLNENIENKFLEFNTFQNNSLYYNSCNKDFLNEKFKFNQYINNEENNIIKTINKNKINNFSFFTNKFQLINHKRKHNNLNPKDSKLINKNVYEELINSFDFKSPNKKISDFPHSKKGKQRQDAINSSVVNINSTQKNNNNIGNTYLKGKFNGFHKNNNKKNLYKKSIQYDKKEDEYLLKELINENNNEKNLENNSYIPQIFESQNSSIMIGGIEYTTLLVPKRYLGKIKAKLYQS